MGTLRWEREDRERSSREVAQREGELREREAELALAETKARAQSVVREQAVREGTLDRIKAERRLELNQQTTKGAELRERRRADAPKRSRQRAAGRGAK